MPPRGRPPAVHPLVRPTCLAIGNCTVEFPAGLKFEQNRVGIQIKTQDKSTITITVDLTSVGEQSGVYFTLVNPKNVDAQGRILLQEVLQLYNQELPAMSYAANTGKESRFLENCIMNGKYCTLLLSSSLPVEGEDQVIGAVTYQILPPDTQFAEIPLAAVRQTHQRKGFGALLFKELQKRLWSIGVNSIFCWGDQESEIFWTKQGFVTVAEVDGRGKPRKLPIKGDLRKAMSIPGSATLMVSHLSHTPHLSNAPVLLSNEEVGKEFCSARKFNENESNVTPPRRQYCSPHGEKKKSSPILSITTPNVGELKSIPVITPAITELQSSGKKGILTISPLNMEGKLSKLTNNSPFNDITNIVTAATGPPKKRPYTGASSSTVDPLNDCCPVSEEELGAREPITEKDFNGEEGQENHDNVVGSLQGVSSSGFSKKLGLKRGRGSSVPMKPCGVRSMRRRRGNSNMQPFERVSYEETPGADDAGLESKTCIELQAGEIDSEAIKSGDMVVKSPAFVPALTENLPETKDNRVQLEIVVDLPDNSLCSNGAVEQPGDRDATKEFPEGMGHLLVAAETMTERRVGGEAACTGPEALYSEVITERTGEGNFDNGQSAGKSPQSVILPEKLLGDGVKDGHETSIIRTKYIIMFMNMADDNQKKQLTKLVERLGGIVTNDGQECSHVVTGVVRRTLNFCVALCSGAWILSSDWLKTSVKYKQFVDETRFILRDKQFESKYKCTLRDVIDRAKRHPNSLLSGFNIYPTKNIHPSVDTIRQIVISAGGKVLANLEEAVKLNDIPRTIVVACEVDMSEALSAAKAGLRTHSADWLLSSVVKQDLELMASQFTESL